MALDMFDRLRLREPFAHAFEALGFEGEEAWRRGGAIKVVLLSGRGRGTGGEAEERLAVAAAAGRQGLKAEPQGRAEAGEPPIATESEFEGGTCGAVAGIVARSGCALADGVHEAEGHTYMVRERYEELLWWLLMPELLRMSGEKKQRRAAAAEMGRNVEEALATAAAAGYRIDVLLGLDAAAEGEAEAAKTTQEAGPGY